MFAQLRACLVVFGLLTVVTGVMYPVVVTLFAQGLFPQQATGSLIQHDGKPVGEGRPVPVALALRRQFHRHAEFT